MAPKVGINGFGRIGRLVLRAAIAKGVEVSSCFVAEVVLLDLGTKLLSGGGGVIVHTAYLHFLFILGCGS